MNYQPNNELKYFQRLVVQDLFVKQLNKWLDELEWENEKKDALIDMKDAEILELHQRIDRLTAIRIKVENEFKEYAAKVKGAKINLTKNTKQQTVIDELRGQLESTKRRLEVSHRMNQLLTKQNKP